MLNLVDVMIFTETVERGVDAFEKLQDIEIDARIDKEILMQLLIRECGALTPMYYEREAFWYNHKCWFKLNKEVIRRLIDTTEYEYDPLENYDWNERIKDNGSLDRNTSGSSDSRASGSSDSNSDRTENGTTAEAIHGTVKNSGTDTTSTTGNRTIEGSEGSTGSSNRTLDSKRTDDLETESKTSAYNENLYQPESLVTNTGTVDNHETETISENKHSDRDSTETNTNKEDLKHGKIVTNDESTNGNETKTSNNKTTATDSNEEHGTTTGKQTDKTENNREREVLGATGLFTKQKLIKEQREVEQFNVYEWIISKYKRECFYLVY